MTDTAAESSLVPVDSTPVTLDKDRDAVWCTGTIATQDDAGPSRVERIGLQLGEVFLEPTAIRAWGEEYAELRRHAARPPFCSEDSPLRFISKAWLVIAVPSLLSKHASKYLMRRASRASTFSVLAIGLWAMWPGPLPWWAPIAIAWWLFS